MAGTWTRLTARGETKDLDRITAVLSMVDNGLMIEDYSDLSTNGMYGELIDEKLLAADRTKVAVSCFLPEEKHPKDTLAFLRDRFAALGIPVTFEIEGLDEKDWAESWKQYYQPIPLGRVTIVPAWQSYTPAEGEVIVRMDPGMAFGTGTHETTSLCLETLDSLVKGGERVLDIGTGSGILAIAALKLGAKVAEGVDIDPMCVRTAGENAARNGVADRFTVLVGDLSDQASGQYNIITANIVAAAILSLAPHVPVLMAPGARFIASGIIDERKDEVITGLKAAGLTPIEVKEKRGWVCVICKKSDEKEA